VTRIAVLAGGRSPEREVSLRSGHRVLGALRSRGHDAALLDPAETPMVEALSAGGFAACYVALHGKDGEDGTAQRLLELLAIPYTGTGPFACQLAFDKVLAKEALRASGVATPAWATIQASALRDLSGGAILHRALERVGLPAVVKPSRSGSAMGLHFVDSEAGLPAAVMGALAFSDAVLIEAKVEGTEVAAAMAGDPGDLLPLVEIVPRSGVYDYAARYTAGATEYYAPARLAPETAAACAREASRAFEVLGLRDVGRTDLIVDPDGRPWVLEVNVSPAGLSLADLCDRVLQRALARA